MYRFNTPRDRMHVAAFRSIYRANPELAPVERFAYALVSTCDDALDRAGKHTLIEQWQATYADREMPNRGVL